MANEKSQLQIARSGGAESSAAAIERLAAEEAALGELLRLSLQPYTMKEYLQEAIETIFSQVPWLNLLRKGAILLNERNGFGERLHMVGAFNIDKELCALCEQVPFGHCMCGRAAQQRETLFAGHIDERHDVHFEGMTPHGHYNVPIIGENRVLGVLALYLVEGHRKDPGEMVFLGRIADVLSMGILNRYAKHEATLAAERWNAITRNIPGIIFRRVLHMDGSVEIPFASVGSVPLDDEGTKRLLNGSLLEYSLIHEDDRGRVIKLLADSAAQLTPLNLEYRIALGAEVHWIQCSARPQRSANGEVVWDGLLLDISERKALETQLVQAQKLESVGQLAAGIAHEINTPTQFVNDNVHFLKDAFDDLERLIGLLDTFSPSLSAEQCAEIQRITEEIDHDYLREEVPKAFEQSLEGLTRITRIVRAMKEFSHPGTEEKTPFDVNKSVELTVDVSRNEWKYDAEIDLDLDPNLPEVPGFPGEINQTLLNIVVNAAHAISATRGEGEMGRITIHTCRVGDYVEISIADNGPGMPEYVRKRVFDPFFTTKKVGKGTGQGLALAYSAVVDKHGGSIDVTSEPGTGATFTVRLPINP